MTATYDCIATTTLTTNTASVTFSSIPQTYTDLVLIATGLSAGANTTTKLNVGNGSIDTGSNYSRTVVSATNSNTTASQTEPNLTYWFNQWYANWTTNTQATDIIQIMNYSNTTTHKTALFRANCQTTGVDAQVGLWRSTSAINIIQYAARNVNTTLASGTTISLYGIKAE